MARILITNDDGVDAPGIAALYDAAGALGERIVLAPDSVRSGCGHAVTTSEPLRLTPVRPDWYAIDGTPADCARLAISYLVQDADWVLSGINRGGNLGADTYISGTVAAAREATFLGKRAIAVSQYVRPDLPVDWDWSRRQTLRVLDRLIDEPLEGRAFWNVNLPHLPARAPDPELVFCGLDLEPLDVGFQPGEPLPGGARVLHYTGKYHGRKHTPGRDVAVCFGGDIAVTLLPLDITG